MSRPLRRLASLLVLFLAGLAADDRLERQHRAACRARRAHAARTNDLHTLHRLGCRP